MVELKVKIKKRGAELINILNYIKITVKFKSSRIISERFIL
jgi:hypothetical protein